MILLTGSTGILGSTIKRYFDQVDIEFVATSRDDIVSEDDRLVTLELRSSTSIRDAVNKVRPDWILHCAALTDVDFCEKNQELAREINVAATAELAKAAEDYGARVLYISTDSVFDGHIGQYSEEDTPNPLNCYAHTKLEAEKKVLEYCRESLVLRTNLFGWSPQPGRGLAEWAIGMFRSGKPVPGFTDCHFNPPFTRTLAQWATAAMQADLSGIYHFGTADSLSKWEFLRCLAVEMDFDDSTVFPATMGSFPQAAKRPKNTVLKAEKLAIALKRELPSLSDEFKSFIEFKADREFQSTKAITRIG
jgi:dTDP-4-dehydrorhamnose reductase